MSYYLIGIGGTGARCLESFIHLCGAGLLKDSQPVKIIYVDADVSCGNLQRTQKTARLYQKAKKLGFGNTGLFKNDIDDLEPWSPVPEGYSSMDDVFQRTILTTKNEYKGLGLLYDSLFTEQERTTSLDKGFRGHPAIGAAIMSQSVNADDQEMWNQVKQEIDTDKDARVFLFASVFGGTGAAGFPTIAKILKNNLKKDVDGNSIAKIGGALILPYFQFPPAPDEEEQEMQAKVSEFMLNTKSALDYYDKNGLLGDIFNSIYLIGDNDLTEMKEFSLGANSQKNNAHFIELYAALAAIRFFNKENFDKVEVPMIARGDDTIDTIDKVSWEDLPEVDSRDVCLKNKLSSYIQFLYAYKNCILPKLRKCAENKSIQNQYTWYIDLLKKDSKIDVYEDNVLMEQFNALGDYIDEIFSWWKQIILENKKRNINLLNKQILNDSNWQSNNLDICQVVLPIQENENKMTYSKFLENLNDYKKEIKKDDDAKKALENASGAEKLMVVTYYLCNK